MRIIYHCSSNDAETEKMAKILDNFYQLLK